MLLAVLLSCNVLLIQGFGQQNSGANQGNYGTPEAGPGIDQSLSAHVPGGQGVSTATEQVISPIWLLLGGRPNLYCGKQTSVTQVECDLLSLGCRALAV